nr:hypothetical protein CTI12_AA080440 [Tanacetum cinerariifolium]
MKIVLESGPWMVNNVLLVRNIWEPGIWLEKVEPSTIPICVCVYNIPMDLCDGNGIGKIMSGVGKPMLMDKMTKERCLKKSGKLNFARVLVKVNAKEKLPHVLEIAYPLLEVLKGGGSVINKGDNGNLDEYGLVEVGMKNMHVPLQSKPSQRNNSKNVKYNANIVVDVKKSSSHKVSGGIMKPSVDISNFNPKLDYFVKNFHKYGIDPYDNEEDVQTKTRSLVEEMRPENVDSLAPVNDGDDDAQGVKNV